MRFEQKYLRSFVRYLLVAVAMVSVMPVLSLFTGTALGAPGVAIPDDNLRAVLEQVLGKGEGALISAAHLSRLTGPAANNSSITDLTGLEFCVNLERLILENNHISDISALASLTKLPYLDLDNKHISDISALASLSKLHWLHLTNNNTNDISVLASMAKLVSVDLRGNELNSAAYAIHIPALEARGVGLSYDPAPPAVEAGVLPGVKNSIFKQEGAVKDANRILTLRWTKVSGLGDVVFGTPNAAQTTVRADTDGRYTIRLTAVDAAGTSNSDDITFTWDTIPPVVEAGTTPGVKNSNFKQEGRANDASGISTLTWSKVTGLGEVVFGTPNAAKTTVRADIDGHYTIRLTAVDGAGNSSSDDVTFTYDPAPPAVEAESTPGIKNSNFKQTGEVKRC